MALIPTYCHSTTEAIETRKTRYKTKTFQCTRHIGQASEKNRAALSFNTIFIIQNQDESLQFVFAVTSYIVASDYRQLHSSKRDSEEGETQHVRDPSSKFGNER